MGVASPLRYPGGKASMTDLLRQVRALNLLNGHAVAEPFAGGAGAALSLLYLRETHEIHINDLDPAIRDFWHSAVHDSAALISYLEKAPVTVDEWKRWRGIYRDVNASSLDRGFAAFYLNRCNRSGIIESGGVIGGLDQDGRWKIDARFNKEALRTRLERIAEERERIFVSGLDGIDFLDTLDADSTFFFIDPPYFKKGPLLYLNGLDREYHTRLAKKLRTMCDAAWILTYDDCAEIRELYGDWAAVHPFSLRYSARERRQGRELLIAPRWVTLPDSQRSLAVSLQVTGDALE
jgi:DNA adenine methylase